MLTDSPHRVLADAPPSGLRGSFRGWIHRLGTGPLPGIALALAVAGAAAVLSKAPFAPFTLANGLHPLGASSLAILLGLILGNLLPATATLKAGVCFCTRVILPVGIVLLGARLAFADLVRIGGMGVLLASVGIATCTAVGFALVRWFSLPPKLATLIAVGTAICGGSAIAAVAPSIDADDEDVAWSVSAVALLGLVLMFLLPVLGHLLGVDATHFGMWAGLTIHQTPQVVAAGLAYGGEAAEVATLIKLVRVAMLAPMVFVIGFLYARNQAAKQHRPTRWSKLVPPFVVGFLVMAAMRSLGWLDLTVLPGSDEPTSLLSLARLGDTAALAIAMAAIGLGTRLAAFRRTGARPLLAGVLVTVAAVATTYTAILFVG